MRFRIAGATSVLLLAVVCMRPGFCADKPSNGGAFTDRLGRQHAWSITPTHALLWDGQAYVPVGGTFAPHYFADGQTEANWALDAKALDTLKAHGTLDILIDPLISAIDISPSAWQRLIDYLDAGGFRYGIGFGAGIKTPLSGIIVKPGSYRVGGVGENVDASWSVSDCDAARYVIADKDGVILKSGQVRVQNGMANVAADATVPAGSIGLLYPRKTLRPAREGALPDLWSDYDHYRDRLLALFGQLKFGPGLRFFLDPLAHPIAVLGETEYLIPDSPAFRLEWEAFLSRRYLTLDDLAVAWHLVDRDIKDYREAAALVPLWAGRRGVPAFLDTSTGKVRQADTNVDASKFWSDVRECRNDAIVYAMSAAADFLKKEIADVPVVYTYTQQHRMFTNPNKVGGFDGLGIAAYAEGSALVTGGADSAYSQCDEAARTMWLLVTETQDSVAAAKDKTGYTSEQTLAADLDWLRGIGAKGFFVNGYQVLPEPAYQNYELLRAPDQLDWLKRYSDRLHRGMDLALSRPHTLPFPASAAGLVHAGPIGSGDVWWVPSLAPGKPIEFGTSYAGYSISLPGGDRTVIWSLRGPRETHVFASDPRSLEITTADGAPVTGKIDLKRHTITISMGSAPLVFRTRADDVFPLEATEDALKQLHALLTQALAQKLPVDEVKFDFDNAFRTYRTGPKLALMIAADALNKIGSMLQPYAWIEGESADPHSFSEAALNDAASGGAFLVLNTETRPGPAGYAAQYKFSIPVDDAYMVWVACTPPGPQASPFAWVIDTGEPHTVAEASPVGAPYLSDRLQWLRLGRANLTKGQHTLTIRATDKAAAIGKYYLALDSLLITRFAFTPSGISKPPLAAIAEGPVPALVVDRAFGKPFGKKK